MCSLPRRLPRRLAAHQTVPALPLTTMCPVFPQDGERRFVANWRHRMLRHSNSISTVLSSPPSRPGIELRVHFYLLMASLVPRTGLSIGSRSKPLQQAAATGPPVCFSRRISKAICHDPPGMPKWAKWTILPACVLVAWLLVVFLAGEREPSYQGRSLSAWIDRYVNPPSQEPDAKREAAAAIQQIGTNALPCLLECMRYEIPATGVRAAIITRVKRLPRVLSGPAFRLLVSDHRFARADKTGAAFWVLGAEASPALPQLTRMMMDTNHPYASRRAMNVLASIGEDAIPAISAYITDTNMPQRRQLVSSCAIAAMRGVKGMLPLTLHWLELPDEELSSEAADALRSTAEHNPQQPELVVAALTNCLRTDSRLKQRAIEALGEYRQRAKAAVPVLLPLLADPEPFFRVAASNALMKIAPEALTNVPPP